MAYEIINLSFIVIGALMLGASYYWKIPEIGVAGAFLIGQGRQRLGDEKRAPKELPPPGGPER
jgi:hypothetical protein